MIGVDGKCSARALQARDARPAVILPKPVVPKPEPIIPVGPKPGVPVTPGSPGHMPEILPNQPKPVEPIPQPKPVDPAPQPLPGNPAPVCKRTPAGNCQVTKFQEKYIEDIRAKGEGSQADLESKQNVPNPVDVQRDPVSTNYQGQGVDEDIPYTYFGQADDFWLNKQFSDIRYTDDVEWRTSTIRNKGADTSGENAADNSILTTHERPEQHTMIIADSQNAEKDLLRGQPGMLRWSDMVMNNWVEASKAVKSGAMNPNELRYMIQNNIRDGESAQQAQIAINAAIIRNKGDGTTMQTYRSDPKLAGDDELAAYQLIAGTAHGDRVLKMLGDYPQTMKNVRIESFSVFTPKTVPGPGEYAIMIKFYKPS